MPRRPLIAARIGSAGLDVTNEGSGGPGPPPARPGTRAAIALDQQAHFARLIVELDRLRAVFVERRAYWYSEAHGRRRGAEDYARLGAEARKRSRRYTLREPL